MRRFVKIALVAALGLALVAVAPALARKHRRKDAPIPSHKYSGVTSAEAPASEGPCCQFVLTTSANGKSVVLVGGQFSCPGRVGQTGLQNLPIHRTKKGFTFSGSSSSAAADNDGSAETVQVTISGRFTFTAANKKKHLKSYKGVKGTWRVVGANCDTTVHFGLIA